MKWRSTPVKLPDTAMYKQSIILFGIVVPAIILGVLMGVCALIKSKVSSSFANKEQYYSGYEMNRMTALEIEARLSQQRAHSDRWAELLKQETFSLVTTNLRTIAEELPPKEFQQTAFERLGQSGGFGGASAQKSSGLKFNFRGTFRTVQQAFLELETKMPNLQLQELRIDPTTNGDSALLNFQVTYTAWEN
ncbi:hypothetical protein [Luteolibacter sp. AS25]|uniref:hypothetical protein n=1 Tax=Luteolibacter sp. AS25 TaxID=3135776 RepID=UPI00398BA47A